MQTGGHMHAVRSGQQTQQNVAAGHIIKVVAAVMDYALCFLKMEFINQQILTTTTRLSLHTEERRLTLA